MKLALKYWFFAARPKTLPAAIVPVCVGVALAAPYQFKLLPAVICLAFSVLIQIATNFANDYYDFIKGADNEKRIGPDRAVASGWISPRAMKVAMSLTFFGAFGLGLFLVYWGGFWLIGIGIASVLCGICYTGGPYPLGYNGLGDVFVFVFFGWVATVVTFYLQVDSFQFLSPWLAALVPGALATNLLVVNNYRDAPEDARVGKRTLAVRFGRRVAFGEFLFLNLLSLVVPVFFLSMGYGQVVLLPLLSIFFVGFQIYYFNKAKKKEDFTKVLGMTAGILVFQGLLFAVGLYLGAPVYPE